MELFFELLQLSLGTRDNLSWVPDAQKWKGLYELSEEQAILGVMQKGLERLSQENFSPPKNILLQWIGRSQIIQQRNQVMNKAVVSLSKELVSENNFLVVKGQTLAMMYPAPNLRQSGDIDYLVHPDYWDMAIEHLKEQARKSVIARFEDSNALKHVEWQKNGVQYEMHRSLASFSCARHQRYWEEVIMPEVWATPWTVSVDGYDVPTLAPVYNVMYVFEHIFEHFIKEGIGLRQFVDWYYLMDNVKWKKDDVTLLEMHLKGIGLFDAFCGMGAILTDYLGLEEKRFPFVISKKAHSQVPKLIKNILKLGNFGHNKVYLQDRGVVHGIQRLTFIAGQSIRFGHYAPSETWSAIPHMFKWWGTKMSRRVKK